MARWLLAQVTHQALRKDARLREWFKRIKRRRGSTIARVAVMRKLATMIWHMLRKRRRMPSAGRSRPAEQEVAGTIVTNQCRRKTAKETREVGFARLFDPRCLTAARDPSRFGQLERDRGCGGLNHRQGDFRQPHVALDGVALAERNSHQINQRLPRRQSLSRIP